MEILVGTLDTVTYECGGFSLRMDDTSTYEEVKNKVDSKAKIYLKGNSGVWDWSTWHSSIKYAGRTPNWIQENEKRREMIRKGIIHI